MTRKKHVLSGLLLSTALSAVPAAVPAQDLGIDCHEPRRTPDGRIIYDQGHETRALCEADRARALAFAALLTTVRSRVAQALRVLPPPLLESFVQHLETDSDPAAWRPAAADLDALRNLPATQAWAWHRSVPAFWENGVLDGAGIDAGWQVRARGCRVGPLDDAMQVLVWLEPASLGDRWTPAMVQRTVSAWHALRERRGLAVERAPRVTAGTSTAPALRDADGQERPVDACFGAIDPGPWAPTVRPLLAMETRVGWPRERERRDAACTDPGLVGFRREERTSLRGVFLDAAGAPLLDGSGNLLADGNAAWHETRNLCRVPREIVIPRIEDCDTPGTLAGRSVQGHVVREYLYRERRVPGLPTRVVSWPVDGDGSFTAAGATQTAQPGARGTFCDDDNFPDPEAPVVTSGPVPQCVATHGNSYPLGSRPGEWRRIDYPDGWPVADRYVVWEEDRCYRTDTRSRSESRTLGCPAGQLGSVSQRRSVTDSRRIWSPESGRAPGPWRVSSAGGWSTTSNTCYTPPPPPPPPPDDDDDDGTPPPRPISDPPDDDSGIPPRPTPNDDNDDNGGDETSFTYAVDIDGDGDLDFSTIQQAAATQQEGWRPPPGSIVWYEDTSSPDIEDDGDDSDGDDDKGGCFLTTAVVGRRGEADDGPTLTALRAFRDGWMATHPEGPALVAEYYEVAPRIVAAIPRDHPDWDWVGTQVDRAVAEIAAARPEAAFETYCGMVRRLRDRWLSESRATHLNPPAAPSRAA
ncbi:MAG: hypothetical protein OXH76_03855 [Boseongicola sp.]|nr:hypothetical protein [Boseongicola sp.]